MSRLLAPVRAIAGDGWVVGIAAAAALAYSAVQLGESIVSVALQALDGMPVTLYADTTTAGDDTANVFDYPYTFVVNGHVVYYEPLVRSLLLFLVVMLIAAAALHATRSPADEEAAGDV